MKNSMENVHTDVRMERVKRKKKVISVKELHASNI